MDVNRNDINFTDETTPVSIDQWYDRSTRCYVTLLKDADGYQVGAAEYDPNRTAAAATKARFQRQLDGAK